MSLIADAWRARRSPKLAALADLEGDAELTARLDAVIAARVSGTLANLRAFDDEDSPLFSSWVLRQLENPPFTGPSAEPLVAQLIATAERLRDPRLVERAPQIAKHWTVRITPKPARVRLIARLDEAVSEVAREPVRKPTPEEAKREAEWTDRLGGRATTKRTAEDLLADIYANPRDDAPRAVYADFLLEQGDPRGEFITLQLANTDPERQQALLKKHGKDWLGPLASVISWGKGYSGSRYARGFLAVADFIQVAERKVAVIIDDPSWATIEDLAGAPRHLLLTRAPMRGLRRLRTSIEEIERLAQLDRILPSLERLELGTPGANFDLFARVFPALETLMVTFQLGPTVDEVRDLLREAKGRLKRLELHRWVEKPETRQAAVPFDELVAAVRKLEPLVPSVALKPPFARFPGDPPVELVASGGRFVLR